MTVSGGSSLRRYRIDRYLTEGGMGAIYVGRRLGAGGFEKEVVLKQLLPEFINRPEFRDLFFREAKITAGLDHVNIVRTYDLVRSEDSLFIVMENVAGSDLRTIAWRARLRRQPISVAAIMHIGMEILAGLDYAHARTGPDQRPLGIVHRDISPSNILCSGHGDVKLSDFGIAKQTTFASTFYRVRGKVGYMSPEQARNLPLDGRSDLYSLGVCLFEALTGERLFVGDLQTPPDALYGKPLPRLVERRPEVPIGLDQALRRVLSQRPEERYQNAAEFQLALRQVAREHGLLYSASQLARELREVLGPDPEKWSQEDALPMARGETEKMKVAAHGASDTAADPSDQSPTPIQSPPRGVPISPPVQLHAHPGAAQHPIPSDTLEAVPLSTRSLPTFPDAGPPAGSARSATDPRKLAGRTRWMWAAALLAIAAGAAYFILQDGGGALPDNGAAIESP